MTETTLFASKDVCHCRKGTHNKGGEITDPHTRDEDPKKDTPDEKTVPKSGTRTDRASET